MPITIGNVFLRAFEPLWQRRYLTYLASTTVPYIVSFVAFMWAGSPLKDAYILGWFIGGLILIFGSAFGFYGRRDNKQLLVIVAAVGHWYLIIAIGTLISRHAEGWIAWIPGVPALFCYYMAAIIAQPAKPE